MTIYEGVSFHFLNPKLQRINHNKRQHCLLINTKIIIKVQLQENNQILTEFCWIKCFGLKVESLKYIICPLDILYLKVDMYFNQFEMKWEKRINNPENFLPNRCEKTWLKKTLKVLKETEFCVWQFFLENCNHYNTLLRFHKYFYRHPT